MGPTVGTMDLAQNWARYGDRVLVTALAVVYAVELLRWDDVRLALAIPLGTAACFLLLLRKRLPVAMVVLVLIAIQLVEYAAPGFDDEAISFPLVMLTALYFLGRWARGLQAWLGFGVVVVCISAFVIDDGANDASDVAFGIAFIGTPWAVGLAMRLRRDREDQLRPTPSCCVMTRRTAPAARWPRSVPGSRASCTTWSRTRSR